MNELDAHLQKHLQLTAESVARWVEERWGVRYTASGVTHSCVASATSTKKPKRVSGKANRAAQEAHLKIYEDLHRDKGEDDPIYFVDAVHPQHQPVPAPWLDQARTRAPAGH